MRVATTVLSLIAATNAKAIADGQICTIFDTCASVRGCCVAVSETNGGIKASPTKGVCVPDGTNQNQSISVTQETTVAIKFGWYDTAAYTLDPCVALKNEDGDFLGASSLMAIATVAAATILYTLA